MLATDADPTTMLGVTIDTHVPTTVSLYPTLHAHAQAYASWLPMKWLYLGSWLVLHDRQGASASASQAPRYWPAPHDDVLHDTHDSPDRQYPS